MTNQPRWSAAESLGTPFSLRTAFGILGGSMVVSWLSAHIYSQYQQSLWEEQRKSNSKKIDMKRVELHHELGLDYPQRSLYLKQSEPEEI